MARTEAAERHLRLRTFGLVALLSAGAAAPAAAPAPPPSLIVAVAVDQLRPDLLLRYRSQFTGGFRRLLDRGAVFTHARQDHAITETAPGHATLLSGREPSSTGIVDNQHGVGDPTMPLLDADGPGASPHNFRGTTLLDWLRAVDPATRSLAVSQKDRAAILMTGRARAPVFWWSAGRFTTSRYYADALPAWVRAFNARRSAERFAGRRWSTLLPASAYAEPDSVPWENEGRDVAFPHPFPPDAQGTVAAFPRYPWMDSLTLAFALDGVVHVGLGRRPRPDLLAVSLSTTDAVGHAFGPDSREIHDQLLRLDRWLGWFLDSLAVLVPSRRTLVVLSADHGVQSMPERARAGSRAGRVWLDDLAAEVRAALPRPVAVAFDAGLFTADTAALRRAGADPDSVAASLARAAAARAGVRRVFTPATLRRAPPDDAEANLWRHALPPDLGWLACAVIEPGWVWSPPGVRQAQHGSTAPADVEVPIIWLGVGIRAARYDRPVRTADLAPTLARLVGVRPLERLDGARLPELPGPDAGQE